MFRFSRDEKLFIAGCIFYSLVVWAATHATSARAAMPSDLPPGPFTTEQLVYAADQERAAMVVTNPDHWANGTLLVLWHQNNFDDDLGARYVAFRGVKPWSRTAYMIPAAWIRAAARELGEPEPQDMAAKLHIIRVASVLFLENGGATPWVYKRLAMRTRDQLGADLFEALTAR